MLPEDSAEYRRVMESVLDRVTARVFLELIAGLSPEQAKRVAGDLSKGNPEPAATIQALSKEVPDLALRIAQALTRMRGELLTDIGEIVKANGK